VDLALVLGLEGVQLGARSLPPSVVRELLGPEALVGVSVHGPDEAVRAENGGADYLVVGTIFPSPSHPGRSGAGPERVAAVSGGTRVPALAIGGITPERVRAVLESGAHGVAVLSGIWDAEDPGAALDRYLGALRDRA
nr:thiamine phosphate synthase [Gemmatimonadota bacterium]NIR77255.1 thiamine phosphate synthase [Gemmatimonadota bacterium]NIT85774.1 thiamine phosphate synthase [Gemmatimonadota bacterium]NIU29599.1 thiamine phosphate synthase [Gemmatimonadota bacterium]NIU34648.1 thiamine phosphate synthase [Gemmatimonadota bacterium]